MTQISPERLARHHCHARGCNMKVPPRMLMCKRHWFMVPKAIRDEIWEHYQTGQEVTMECSEEWHKAADKAIAAVAVKEAIK